MLLVAPRLQAPPDRAAKPLPGRAKNLDCVPDTTVWLCPIFEVKQWPEFKACWNAEEMQGEPGCLSYGFVYSDTHAFCRQSYRTAQDVLDHLVNCKAGELPPNDICTNSPLVLHVNIHTCMCCSYGFSPFIHTTHNVGVEAR